MARNVAIGIQQFDTFIAYYKNNEEQSIRAVLFQIIKNKAIHLRKIKQ